MSNYWAVDLARSTFNAYNKKTKKWQIGVPISAIPSIAAAMAARTAIQVEVPDSQKNSGPYYNLKGPTYIYRLPVAPPPLVDSHVFKSPLLKTAYHVAKRSGDIIMSDYEAINVEVTRPAFRWPGITDGYRVFNDSFASVLGYGNYTQIPDTDSTYKLNYQLNVCCFYYVYYTQDGSNFSYAPLPDMLGLASCHVQQPDTALVTSATAAANSGYWDALTEMGELPETLRLVGDALRFVRNSSYALGSQLGRGIRTLKVNENLPGRATLAMNEKWMAYRYGLQPVAYSISDIQGVIEKWADRIFRSKKSSTTIQNELPSDELYQFSSPTVDVRHRIVIKDRYDASTFCSKLRSLVSFNPFSTAYELTRLSFVLDWFANIGDYISAFTSVDTFSERKCCYSTKVDAGLTYALKAGNGPIALVLIRNYKRVVINPSDHIGLTTDVTLNWKRCLDAFALTVSPLIKSIRSLK